MTSAPASVPGPAASPVVPPAGGTAAAAGHAALAHLFRASLRQGRLHPLYVPMQQYRGGRDAAPA